MAKGLIRKLDELGRLTLDAEMRKALGMVAGEFVEVWEDNGILKVKLFNKKLAKGTKRLIDNVGRVTIPKGFCRSLNICERAEIGMYIEGQVICLKPVRLQCICCGNAEEDKLVELNGVYMCHECIKQMWEAL